MTRRIDLPPNSSELLKRLVEIGPTALNDRAKLQLAQQIRTEMPPLAEQLDAFLIDHIARLNRSLADIQHHQQELAALLEKMSAPPWFPAVYFRTVRVSGGIQAAVAIGGQCRLVGFAAGLDEHSFSLGEMVVLNHELNLVVGGTPDICPPCGETAMFDRYLEDGRLLLKHRDDEVLVEPAGKLRDTTLSSGDQVRWDKNTWLAFERIPRTARQRFFLDEVPDIQTQQVGGQSANLRQLIAALTTTLVHPDKALAYHLASGRNSILMCGPPGCGKTLMTRAAVAEVSRLSGRRCRFAIVNAAEWEDPFVGVTQQNIRACFQALRKAAQEGDFGILFIDEVEAAGHARGSAFNQHSDKFLAALLCELDGFKDRAGVAIIAATNRKDLLDPALLERLSDVEIQVARPDLRGARSIFEIHLPADLPYCPNGSAAMDTRREIIDTAVSRLYAPNAENELCTLRFRDGKTRTVFARELVSGRAIEQICRFARQAAFLRDVETDQAGISVADMNQAVATTISKMATTVTHRNARIYLSDLPQDIDIVSVEPVVRRLARPYRYLNVN